MRNSLKKLATGLTVIDTMSENENQNEIKSYITNELTKNGRIMPVWFIKDEHGMTKTLSVPYQTEEEKLFCTLTIRSVIQKLNAKSYTFCNSVSIDMLYPSGTTVKKDAVISHYVNSNVNEVSLWIVEDKQLLNPSLHDGKGSDMGDLFDANYLALIPESNRVEIEYAADILLGRITHH